MCALKRKFLDNCPSEFQPTLYRRYVDDTFSIPRNRKKVDKFLSYINSRLENTTFTAELGNDNKLPFLDTLVMFIKNSFSSDLFRKKTFTGLYRVYTHPAKYFFLTFS